MAKHKVYGVWHGGASYSHPYANDDIEEFDSIYAAGRALQDRARNGAYLDQLFNYIAKPAVRTFTPGADEGCHMDLYAAVTRERDHSDYSQPREVITVGEPYARLVIGPRGGIARENY